ncbi:hypothetical protein B0T20DRAFT_451413 [Sordaria brevicollis]|uniref:Methyltransferase domain-containing protein n=1 Tax=Sordaria brevicollis TaxID=83679 RepID=A0AAE0UEB2_SORBR|nr:hypothetical protein B0T20DRAFT_451413 [Sordaria brevicollis]
MTTTTPPNPKGNTTTAPATSSCPLKLATKPGASIYSSPLMLTTYDKYVLGFSMTYLWRCPSSSILIPLFRQNFNAEKHLDIGVGTGFFVGDALGQVLASSGSTSTSNHKEGKKVDITLMDLNEVALEKAKERVLGVVAEHEHHSQAEVESDGKNPEVGVKVTTIVADVLDQSVPVGVQRGQFKSVSMFNLLHCLPSVPIVPSGPSSSDHDSGADDNGQEIKNRAFKLAAECLADDGTLAGCTVLGRKYIANDSSGAGSGAGMDKPNGTKTPSVLSKGMTWAVMKWYNHLGTFGNWSDEREVFEKGLRENFEVVETQVVGCMLLFSAARPKRSA